MKLAQQVGVEVPSGSPITIDGKDISVKLAEDAVAAHLKRLHCDYCREQYVRLSIAGITPAAQGRPDVASLRDESPIVMAHDKNHSTWHDWFDKVLKAKQEQREQVNGIYDKIRKASALRGAALKDAAEKELKKLQKVSAPQLPELLDTHAYVGKTSAEVNDLVKAAKAAKTKTFKPKGKPSAKSVAVQASVDRTMRLLELASKGKL